jgi:hypothetical protein
VPPSETGGGGDMRYSRGGGDVRHSWVAAAVPRPGRRTLVTCLSVICNFPDGTRGLKH